MNQEESDLTKRRSPAELKAFCLRYKESVTEVDLKCALLRKNREYKFFIDEVWPLSLFCEEMYDENHRIQPVDGSQGFDAKVYSHDEFLFNIEVVKPHDGARRSAEVRRLIENGVSNLAPASPSDLLAFKTNMVSVCESKSRKDYSDCVLLFYLMTGSVFDGQLAEFSDAMKEVEDVVSGFKFNARGVYLYFSPFGRIVKINV